MARIRKNRTMRHKKRGGQVESSTSSSSEISSKLPSNVYSEDSYEKASNPLRVKRSPKRGGQWQQQMFPQQQQSMYPQQQQSSGWFDNSQPQPEPEQSNMFGSYQGQSSHGNGKPKPWYRFWGGKTKKHSRRRKHGGQAVTGFDGAWDQPATALAGGRRRRHRKH